MFSQRESLKVLEQNQYIRGIFLPDEATYHDEINKAKV